VRRPLNRVSRLKCKIHTRETRGANAGSSVKFSLHVRPIYYARLRIPVGDSARGNGSREDRSNRDLGPPELFENYSELSAQPKVCGGRDCAREPVHYSWGKHYESPSGNNARTSTFRRCANGDVVRLTANLASRGRASDRWRNFHAARLPLAHAHSSP